MHEAILSFTNNPHFDIPFLEQGCAT